MVLITPKYIRPLFPFLTCSSRWHIPEDFSEITEVESVASFWGGYGKKNVPDLRAVSRAELGAPTLSTILERDFDEVGKLENRQRGLIAPAYVEMIF